MAVISHAKNEPLIPHRTDRFPQPSDLMPPLPPPTSLTEPNAIAPGRGGVKIPRDDAPTFISPSEPFTTIDGPGPVEVEPRESSGGLDEHLLGLVDECMRKLTKEGTCRRMWDVIWKCKREEKTDMACVRNVLVGA